MPFEMPADHRWLRTLIWFASISLWTGVWCGCDETASELAGEEDVDSGDVPEDLFETSDSTREDTDQDVTSRDSSETRDSGGPDVDAADVVADAGMSPLGVNASVVAVSTSQLETIRFAALDAASGFSNASQRISPVRGAGYDLGEVRIAATAVPPSGEFVIVFVVHEHDDTEGGIFRLETGLDALPPVRLSNWVGWPRDARFSPDESMLAFGVREGLYVLNVVPDDGPLGSIYAGAAGDVVSDPHWTADMQRVVVEVDTSSQPVHSGVVSVALSSDLEETDAELTPLRTAQHRTQAVLDDGRVVYSVGGALYAVPADGSAAAVRLTPDTRSASLIAPRPGGGELVVTLRDGALGARDLAVVATDGGNADTPRLIATGLNDLDARLTPDGGTLFYSANASAGTWQFYAFDLDSAGAPSPRPVGAPLGSRHFMSGFLAGGDVVGCSSGGTIFRLSTSAAASTSPTELANAGDANCIIRGIAGAGRWIVYSYGEGFLRSTRAVDVDGTVVQELDIEQGLPTVTESGVVSRGMAIRSAIELGWTWTNGLRMGPITKWFEAGFSETRLIGNTPGSSVVWRVDGDVEDAGWWAVQPLVLEPRVHRISEQVSGGRIIGEVPSGILVAEETPDGRRLAALSAYSFDERILTDDLGDVWWYAESEGLVLVARDGGVDAVPVDGSGPRRVLETTDGTTPSAVRFSATGRHVIAATTDVGGAVSIWSTPFDGSASDPVLVGDVGSAFPDSVLAVPGTDRVLITAATTTTAVPHPSAVYTLRIDGTDAGSLPHLGPSFLPHVLWPDAAPTSSAPVAPHTADGNWVFVRPAAAMIPLIAARPDDSETHVVLDPESRTIPHPLPDDVVLAPDDRTLIAIDGQQIVATRVNEDGAQRRLSGRLPGLSPHSGHAAVSQDAVYVSLHNTETDVSGLYRFALDGSTADRPGPLYEVDVAGKIVLAGGELGDVGFFACRFETGSGVCGARLEGSQNAGRSPVTFEGSTTDDNVEVLLGLLGL